MGTPTEAITVYKIQHDQTASSILCRISNPKNKPKYKPSYQQTRLPPTTALSPAYLQKKNKLIKIKQLTPHQDTNTSHTLYEAYTNHWTNQKEERIQPWSLGKGDLKHSKFKKNKIMKRQRNTVQMKKQPRNRGNRQTIWKRIQKNNSKNDQKPLK